jgi:hypothetical protein
MKKPKLLPWSPPEEKENRRYGRVRRQEGEPMFLRLRKFQNDRAIRAVETAACCDCGLMHQFTYEVFREQQTGHFWLVTRAYRMGKLGKTLR